MAHNVDDSMVVMWCKLNTYSRCYIRPVACILQSIKFASIYNRNFDEIAIKKFLRNDLIHELIIVSLSCQVAEYSNPYRTFALKFRRK